MQTQSVPDSSKAKPLKSTEFSIGELYQFAGDGPTFELLKELPIANGQRQFIAKMFFSEDEFTISQEDLLEDCQLAESLR